MEAKEIIFKRQLAAQSSSERVKLFMTSCKGDYAPKGPVGKWVNLVSRQRGKTSKRCRFVIFIRNVPTNKKPCGVNEVFTIDKAGVS